MSTYWVNSRYPRSSDCGLSTTSKLALRRFRIGPFYIIVGGFGTSQNDGEWQDSQHGGLQFAGI